MNEEDEEVTGCLFSIVVAIIGGAVMFFGILAISLALMGFTIEKL